MSPRPRKASDEEIFAAAERAMQRLGPAQLTLGEIAAEAGLTPGALVQRFGSKRGLLLALMASAETGAGDAVAALRARHGSPLAALRAYADHMARMGRSPAMLAHHLAYLQLDLTDPDFRRHLRGMARGARAALRELLAEAVASGELRAEADPDALARAVQVTLGGSLLAWAHFQEGTAARWLRHDLDVLLAPWLRAFADAGTPEPAAAGRSRRRAP